MERQPPYLYPPSPTPNRNPRTERVQCQEIKACYLRLQGSFLPPPPPPLPPPSTTILSSVPSFLFFFSEAGVPGRDGGWGGGVFLTLIKAGRGGGWVGGGGGGEAFLMTGIHSPFLIHLSPSFTLSCLPSFTPPRHHHHPILPFPSHSPPPLPGHW